MPVATSPAGPTKRSGHQPPFWLLGTGLIEGSGLAVFASRHGNYAAPSIHLRASVEYRCRPLRSGSGRESPWHYPPSSPSQQASFSYFPARSYSFSRCRHVAITDFGVFADFLAKTSTITIASE